MFEVRMTCEYNGEFFNGERHAFSSDEFASLIWNLTIGRYEERRVRAERTGVRPNVLDQDIRRTFGESNVFTGLYLLTSTTNKNECSRYVMIATDELPRWLEHNIKQSVPLLIVERSDEDLSSWFRNTLGFAYSVVDIDYIANGRNGIILIEEKAKANVESLSYGQEESYREFMRCLTTQSETFICNVVSNDEVIVRSFSERSRVGFPYGEGAISIYQFLSNIQ